MNDSGEAKDTDSGASLRRHKSLDGGDDSNLRKEVEDKEGKESSGGKKDPRLERRIRNKVRLSFYELVGAMLLRELLALVRFWSKENLCTCVKLIDGLFSGREF